MDDFMISDDEKESEVYFGLDKQDQYSSKWWCNKGGLNMIVAENLHPSYVVDGHGRRTAVMLPIQEYNDLLEDIQDLTMVAERIHEPNIAHEQVLNELRRDGYIPD